VPHCYGWLGLDARGHWYLRDAATQAAGPFPQAKGERIEHDKLRAFITRNYSVDARGCWFFQNGPQRVYVELETSPVVWRLDAQRQVQAPNGEVVQATQCLTDEAGHVYLLASWQGQPVLGLVHSLDVPAVAQALEQGAWPLESVTAQVLAQRYPFVRSPQALQA
jgi:hypothetical protein